MPERTNDKEIKPGFYCEEHGRVPAEQVDRASLIHVRTKDGPCGEPVTLVGGAPGQMAVARRVRDLEIQNEKLTQERDHWKALATKAEPVAQAPPSTKSRKTAAKKNG